MLLLYVRFRVTLFLASFRAFSTGVQMCYCRTYVLLGNFTPHLFLSLFHEGDDVAHSQDSRGHAVGVERLQIIQLSCHIYVTAMNIHTYIRRKNMHYLHIYIYNMVSCHVVSDFDNCFDKISTANRSSEGSAYALHEDDDDDDREWWNEKRVIH